MILGEKRITNEICVERVCDECGESAKWQHTFLLEGSRRNPASKAYGKDDCSWCSDESRFACDEHKEFIRRHPPEGMGWCSTFPRDKFEHMFLYWQKLPDSLVKLQQEQLTEDLTDIILKVAMSHHDDVSKSDEDCAVSAAEEILNKYNVEKKS